MDDSQSTSKPVPCGPIFNVFETPQAGWTLANITCTLSGAAVLVFAAALSAALPERLAPVMVRAQADRAGDESQGR